MAYEPEYGLCRACMLWREYGDACPECGRALEFHKVAERELEQEFFEALLAVQHLWSEDETVQHAHNPQYLLNCTTQPTMFPTRWMPLRTMVGQLRGIAAMHGITLKSGVPVDLGQEIEITINGVSWRAFQRKDGTIHPIEAQERVPSTTHAETERKDVATETRKR